MDVNGTLFINPGENGTVTLNNVTADNIVVQSGAQNSIHLNNVVANSLTIKNDNSIRVETLGTTTITTTSVQSGAILEATDGTFGAIELAPTSNAGITLKGDLSTSTVTIGNNNAANSVTVATGAIVNTIAIKANVTAPTTIINNGSIGSAPGVTTTGNQPVGSTNSADLLAVKAVEDLIVALKPINQLTIDDDVAVAQATTALNELTSERKLLVSSAIMTKIQDSVAKLNLIKGTLAVHISLEQLTPLVGTFNGQSTHLNAEIPNGATLETLSITFGQNLAMNSEVVNVKLMSAPNDFGYNQGPGETWGQLVKGDKNIWSLIVPEGDANPYSFDTAGDYKLQATFKDTKNIEVTVTIDVTVANPGSYEDLVDLVDQAGMAWEDASGNLLGLNVIFREAIQEYTASRGSDIVTSDTNPVTEIDIDGSGAPAYEIYLGLADFGALQSENDYNNNPVHLNVKVGGQRYEFDFTTNLLEKIFGEL